MLIFWCPYHVVTYGAAIIVQTFFPFALQKPEAFDARVSWCEYVAYPDDEVDVAIGEYVKSQADKPHLKAMFCRLSPGKYLYGTQKAEIELDHNKKLEKT